MTFLPLKLHVFCEQPLILFRFVPKKSSNSVEKSSMVLNSFQVAINMVIWAVLLFISACLIADAARHYDNNKKGTPPQTLCDWLDDFSDAKCGHLIGATVRSHKQ